MEGHLQNSPKPGYPVDNNGTEYVSGLSTILVATIQEAKDRISQIEYIFCSQLFPNFKSKSKSLQKLYSEARKAAEDAWKEKEKDLLVQIERLLLEKKEALEENHSLKLEKASLMKEQEEKMNLQLERLNSQQLNIDKLKQELRQKSKEVDEGMDLQNKLLQLVQTKAAVIVNKGKQLKEHEEKINAFIAELNRMEKKIDELQEELRKKNEEVAKGKVVVEDLHKEIDLLTSEIMYKKQLLIDQEREKAILTNNLAHSEENSPDQKVEELQKELHRKTEEVAKGEIVKENLLKKIESLASEIMKIEQLFIDQEREKKTLTAKLTSLEDNTGIQEELRKKTEELEEERKLQKRLFQQIDLRGSEILKNKQQLDEYRKEKNMLLAKVKSLEENVTELKTNYRERNNEVAGGTDACGKLLQQIEFQASELQAEKKKRSNLYNAYKNLKSQYNFLRTKCGLTTGNMIPKGKSEDEKDLARHYQNTITSDNGNQIPDNSTIYEAKEVRNEINSEYETGVKSNKTSSCQAPTSRFPITQNCPSSVKSAPVAGTKRSAPCWRDTRSRQCQDGPDPHDDFLDTPYENARENLNKARPEGVPTRPISIWKDTSLGSSDDETQEMNVNPLPEKQMPVPMSGDRRFKYVEPVRKKAERENLKGIECKQCKKFYDAVLPDNGGKDTDGNNQIFRCEHHDGVSRHRYRYAPPMTPEGFWNIGFESEI